MSFGNNGRLGNQLFQYAALRSLSVRNAGVTCLPPPTHNIQDSGHNAHRMQLFNSKAVYLPIDALRSNVRNTFREKQFHFDKDFFNLPHGTDVHGYFQSEKYFKDIEYLVRRELSFTDQIKYKTDEILRQLNLDKNKSLTSVHVRRTDYLALQEHHPVCTKEYYDSAKSNFTNTIYIIFSDDPKWCQENLASDNSVVVNTGYDFLDLSLMSMCDNNIICNSSFGWWGAWLNKNTNKKVLAPEKWFGKAYSHYDLSDLLPESWIKICI